MIVDAKRRRLVIAAGAMAGLPCVLSPARAQSWPARQSASFRALHRTRGFPAPVLTGRQ